VILWAIRMQMDLYFFIAFQNNKYIYIQRAGKFLQCGVNELQLVDSGHER